MSYRNYDFRGKSGFSLFEILIDVFHDSEDYLLGLARAKPYTSATLMTSIDSLIKLLEVPFEINAHKEIRHALNNLMYQLRDDDFYREEGSESAIILNNLLTDYELEHHVQDDIPFDLDFLTSSRFNF